MTRYNPVSVQRSIDASRVKISTREAKLIHRLLEGRSPITAPVCPQCNHAKYDAASCPNSYHDGPKTSLPCVDCDICPRKNLLEYVDGKLRIQGGWANLCLSCFCLRGSGLGTGKGQYYKWIGTEYKKLRG